MSEKFSKLILWSWFFVLSCTVVSFIGIVALMRSDVQFWNFRDILLRLLGWCCLTHIGIALYLLVVRKWLLSLVAVIVFLFGLIGVLYGGPNIGSVRNQVSSALDVPVSNLVYVGGFLSRESKIVFELTGDIQPKESKIENRSNDENTRMILQQVLAAVNVPSPADEKVAVAISKFPMEFNTVFYICIGEKRWIVFFGNAVM